eukprot:TRINITY_DN5950_c0_g1_i1.p1 TRINITY_DN5950_c0_g1~~TRINITY_DN5950_c0_g1_i1.p1  ORF type:complete len:100 (+),score=9.41 TRINITY_DN5950_c0_g1_i1:379-678(+)
MRPWTNPHLKPQIASPYSMQTHHSPKKPSSHSEILLDQSNQHLPILPNILATVGHQQLGILLLLALVPPTISVNLLKEYKTVHLSLCVLKKIILAVLWL